MLTFQLCNSEEESLRASVDRRVTLDLDTNLVVEDYHSFLNTVESERTRLLPEGVINIRISFYHTATKEVVLPPPPKWYLLHEQPSSLLHELLNPRGKEGMLHPQELRAVSDVTGPYWEVQTAVFKRVPGRYQAIEVEELPRRSCWKNTTAARITVWATP